MAQKRTFSFQPLPGGPMDRRRGWYVFRIFNLYRLVLVAMLLGIFFLGQGTPLFGGYNPLLFMITGGVYVGAVLLAIVSSFRRRPTLPIQTHIQSAVDVVALTLLAHASGGSDSGLIILLIPAIAASSILLPLTSALGVAALAFILMMGEWLYQAWPALPGGDYLTLDLLARLWQHLQTQGDDLVRLGVLGASFLIAALLTHALAERARRGEALAQQRTQELLEMAELNQAIVQHLQSGVVVVDNYARIRLINKTARELLNHPRSPQGLPLGEVSPQLSQRLAAWLSTGMNNPKPFRQDEHLPDLIPSFSHLGGNRSYDTLIFLEDSSQAAQRLQQIKLAALGRLTASIAHEIRNPLASINHGAQLLQESPTASAGDKRLGQIIHDNARRANEIIANVLDLSRREKAKPEEITLRTWLEEFGREFIRSHPERPPRIDIRVQPEDLRVRFDPNHLRQVLLNLCQNAVRHGTVADQSPRIRMITGQEEQSGRAYLEVIDFGHGIPEADARNIFEPFFTTQPRGTGLGLYISREMCEANRAQLQYLRPPEGGACFRLTFVANRARPDTPQWKIAAP